MPSYVNGKGTADSQKTWVQILPLFFSNTLLFTEYLHVHCFDPAYMPLTFGKVLEAISKKYKTVVCVCVYLYI